MNTYFSVELNTVIVSKATPDCLYREKWVWLTIKRVQLTNLEWIDHIQKVCRSSTAAVQSGHSTDSAVITVSPACEIEDIPPMFQLLQLHKFARKL